jgi:MFS family permease
VFFLQVSKLAGGNEPLSKQLLQLDPLGTIVFLPAAICLLMALQWGGVTYPWSDGRIIALFVVAGVLFVAFVGVQWWRKEDATVPPRIIKQRSIALSCIYSILVGGSMLVFVFSLPIWFQAVKKVSAVDSGIRMFPMTIGMMCGVIPAGAFVQKTGYYVPMMYVCVVLTSIGAGLITTWEVDTGTSKWIGYQALFGIGLGAGMQQAVMAAQTVLPQADVAMGVALMFFCQNLGGAIWTCLSQTLFINYLSSHLGDLKGLDIPSIVHAGATQLSRTVPPERLAEVLDVYNDALVQAFYVSVGLCCALIIPAVGMEWKSVKEQKQVDGEAPHEEEGKA